MGVADLERVTVADSIQETGMAILTEGLFFERAKAELDSRGAFMVESIVLELRGDRLRSILPMQSESALAELFSGRTAALRGKPTGCALGRDALFTLITELGSDEQEPFRLDKLTQSCNCLTTL